MGELQELMVIPNDVTEDIEILLDNNFDLYNLESKREEKQEIMRKFRHTEEMRNLYFRFNKESSLRWDYFTKEVKIGVPSISSKAQITLLRIKPSFFAFIKNSNIKLKYVNHIKIPKKSFIFVYKEDQKNLFINKWDTNRLYKYNIKIKIPERNKFGIMRFKRNRSRSKSIVVGNIDSKNISAYLSRGYNPTTKLWFKEKLNIVISKKDIINSVDYTNKFIEEVEKIFSKPKGNSTYEEYLDYFEYKILEQIKNPEYLKKLQCPKEELLKKRRSKNVKTITTF